MYIYSSIHYLYSFHIVLVQVGTVSASSLLYRNTPSTSSPITRHSCFSYCGQDKQVLVLRVYSEGWQAEKQGVAGWQINIMHCSNYGSEWYKCLGNMKETLHGIDAHLYKQSIGDDGHLSFSAVASSRTDTSSYHVPHIFINFHSTWFCFTYNI